MLYKTIMQGRLEFGNKNSYDKALKMFIYRAENYHKSDIIFSEEDIFFEEELNLNIPRLVKQVYEKTYKNTTALLEYVAQFAVSGVLHTWLLEDGKILNFQTLEPSSDKVAVQHFIKGRSLIEEHERAQDAIAALTLAIEKYDRHAQAYEKRGFVNFKLEKYHDALRDYNKALGIDEANPHAYYGRARVHIIKEDYQNAIQDLDLAIKKSVALQPIHWSGRRTKSEVHIKLGEFEKAAFELKLFTRRKFTPDNPNLAWKRWAHFNYGIVLLELEDYDSAIENFEKSLDLEEGNDNIPDAEKLRYRGIAKQKAGQNGYIKDIKDAAELGDKEAADLLKALV